MANRKRAPFNAAGPFRARRNKPLGDIQLEDGKVYDAALFADLNPRRLEALFNAHWFDMAPDAADDEITTAEDLDEDKGAADPLDRDGDGEKGGSLSDAEEAALLADGLTLAEYLELGAEDRDMRLSAAMLKASATNSTATAPETPAGADQAPPAGEGAETPPTEPVEPEKTLGPIAGYQHTGFGRYFPVDAEGNHLADKPVSKAAAEGLAAAAKVPVISQKPKA